MAICKRCGTQNPDGSQFCMGCGANLTTQPAENGSGWKKGCIGCACVAVVVLLLAIGGGAWWFYNYQKEQDKKAEETAEWIKQGEKEWEAKRRLGAQDPDAQTYNGKSVRELAGELGFPAVNIGELPKEGRVYRNSDESVKIRFASINFTEGDFIGTLNIIPASGSAKELWVSPCGCSIYHLSNPDDESEECGYFFVNEGAKEIIISDESGIHEEFFLPKN